MDAPKFDSSVYLHSPAQLARMHVDHYQFILDHPGIQFGVPCIDQYVIPARPGEMAIVCGRPGSGKTTLLARQAKWAAQNILDRGKEQEECVLYVSWEQHAEDLEAYFQADSTYSKTDYAWGRLPMEQVKRKVMGRARFPLWMIGYSQRNVAAQSEPMTLSVVFEAIENLASGFSSSPRPILLCFDYAQLIPWERGYKDRYQQVKAAINATKQLALRVGCPVMVAAQAGRQVDGYSPPIPTMQDAQESSGIEQVCDTFFGIWRPWKTHRDYPSVQITPEINVKNSPELFILRMNKQRKDDGERTWILHFDMGEMNLVEMEVNRAELEF